MIFAADFMLQILKLAHSIGAGTFQLNPFKVLKKKYYNGRM
jgi:hypothetical protein